MNLVWTQKEFDSMDKGEDDQKVFYFKAASLKNFSETWQSATLQDSNKLKDFQCGRRMYTYINRIDQTSKHLLTHLFWLIKILVGYVDYETTNSNSVCQVKKIIYNYFARKL